MPKHPALSAEADVRAYVREQLAAAVADAGHGWHWPALTTASRDAAADSRIVVLRDVSAEGEELVWFSDRRSEKTAQLAADDRCALLFYHAPHRTQLRLYGSAEEITDDAARASYWATISPGGRANYATAHAPGTALPAASDDLPDGSALATDASEVATQAFTNFAPYRTRVARADFLQLLDRGAFRSQWDTASFSFVTP